MTHFISVYILLCIAAIKESLPCLLLDDSALTFAGTVVLSLWLMTPWGSIDLFTEVIPKTTIQHILLMFLETDIPLPYQSTSGTPTCR